MVSKEEPKNHFAFFYYYFNVHDGDALGSKDLKFSEAYHSSFMEILMCQLHQLEDWPKLQRLYVFFSVFLIKF